MPFAFLIFINDLPLVLKNYVVVDLYADDMYTLATCTEFASYLVPTERNVFEH